MSDRGGKGAKKVAVFIFQYLSFGPLFFPPDESMKGLVPGCEIARMKIIQFSGGEDRSKGWIKRMDQKMGRRRRHHYPLGSTQFLRHENINAESENVSKGMVSFFCDLL